MPLLFGNLPTYLASSFINTAASMQAAGVGMAAQSVAFGLYGLYDAARREVRALAGRGVSLRSWLAVSKWVDDAAPFPGGDLQAVGQGLLPARQARRGAGGSSRAQGGPLELSNIRCPVLNILGKWDYVVPPSQTEATTVLAGSRDKESVSLDAGHAGMLVGPGSADLWPRVRDWLAPRSLR